MVPAVNLGVLEVYLEIGSLTPIEMLYTDSLIAKY
jgi:hypothetical protein